MLAVATYKFGVLAKDKGVTLENSLKDIGTIVNDESTDEYYMVEVDGYKFKVEKTLIPDNNKEYDLLEKVTIRFRNFLCNTKYCRYKQ